jgi:Zn-dependent protease with chaperone function
VNFGLLLVGIALLAFPGLWAARTRGCPPKEWTRVSVWAIGTGAAAVFLGLAMTGLPPLLHTVQLDGLLAVCDPVVHRLMVGGPLVGWTAMLLSLVIACSAAAAVRTTRRAVRRARIEPWLGRHVPGDGYEVVVLPTTELIAFGVPGSVPQVVISEGLVEALEPARLDAVIGHEVAHHRLHHARYLLVAAVVDRALGVLPFVRRSTRALEESLEVWADEFAVEARGATREALHGALVAVSAEQARGSGGGIGLGARAARLTERVRCSPVAARGLTYLPAGVLAGCGALLGVGWAASSQHMLALGGYC